VPLAAPPRTLRTVVWPPGTRLRRGHKVEHPPDALVPGQGDTRFAPHDDTSHVYVAATTFAALLESALHDAGTETPPRIHRAQLALWAEAEVALREEVRLIDLRDEALDRVGLDREALVTTSPTHYACTRRWAAPLVGHHVGGRPVHGLLWHSRQAELRARAIAHRPALHEVIAQHPTEVAALWSPPAPDPLLRDTGDGRGPLAVGEGAAYVADMASFLEIPVL
jgi:hypothetical protein